MKDITLNFFDTTATDLQEVGGRSLSTSFEDGWEEKTKEVSMTSMFLAENTPCAEERSASGWDLRQITKLASIRDLMSRERCFDLESRTASIRSIIGHEREFSLKDALAVVDEFDEAMLGGSLLDFHDGISLTGVPTIDMPSQQNHSSTLHLNDMQDEPGEDDIVFFSGGLGFRSDVNNDFNPFEDIDKRLKAAKSGNGATRGAIIGHSITCDATNQFVDDTPKPRKSKVSSKVNREADISVSSEESSGFPRSPKSAMIQTANNSPRKVQRRRISQLEQEWEKGFDNITNNVLKRNPKAATQEIAKAKEIVSKHLEARAHRTNVSQDQESTPSTPRRPTRRLTSRKGTVAHENCVPASRCMPKAHEVLSRHLEARVQRSVSVSTDTSDPPSPRSTRRTARRVANRHKSAEQLERLSTITNVQEAISKHIEARAKASMSDLANSLKQRTHSPTRRTTRTVTSRSKPAELPPSPNTILKAQEVISKHLEARAVRKNSTFAHVTPSTPRTRPASSRRSTAAQVIKEHIERLQLQLQDRAPAEHPQAHSFEVVSEWVTDATSERSDDPFSITASSVTSSRSTRTSEFGDDNTSERLDDPFCVTASSGPSRLGASPRRKVSSRRITPKAASRGSRRSAGATEQAISAAELPPLPELSALPLVSGNSNHDTAVLASLF